MIWYRMVWYRIIYMIWYLIISHHIASHHITSYHITAFLIIPHGYELSRVRVVLGMSCPGYELSWVRVVMGTNCLGYELSWVQVVLGTSRPDPDSGWSPAHIKDVDWNHALFMICFIIKSSQSVWNNRLPWSIWINDFTLTNYVFRSQPRTTNNNVLVGSKKQETGCDTGEYPQTPRHSTPMADIFGATPFSEAIRT